MLTNIMQAGNVDLNFLRVKRTLQRKTQILPCLK